MEIPSAKEIYDKIMNPDVKESRVFKVKETAIIATVVALMVGDPNPKENAAMYKKILDGLNLSDDLYKHILTTILAVRSSLQDVLMMQMLSSARQEPPISIEQIKNLLRNIVSKEG